MESITGQIQTGEIIEIAAKTALSVIPVGGALITAIWDAVKSNAGQKRLDEWKELIETRLSQLDTTLEDLGSNENFASAMFVATEAAIKTSEQKKREYLANAVVNAATCSLEESIVMMFFDMVGKYTLWHLKILDFFENPTKFEGVSSENYYMGSPKTPLYEVYPELSDADALVNKIVKELYTDGLMSTDQLNVTMTGGGMVSSRVTELGRQFIAFLTN